MRTFGKSHKLDHVCYDIRGPLMDEANRMIREGKDVLKLNIGNPAYFGFKTPENLLRRMADSLADAGGYSDSRGLPAARHAIAAYCREKGMVGVDVDDVYTGNGVSELITLSMQGLLDAGDEMLVPTPDYPLWTASVTLAGGKAVHYICDEESDWYPDLEDMRRKITPNTKGIVIINPNNPTGALYPREILEGVAALARENGLILFADEIYDRLVLDDAEHVAMASLAPDVLTVSFNGLSKSHLAAGFRCGWMCLAGEKSHARDYIEGLNLLSAMRLCSNVPSQFIIDAALREREETAALLAPGGRVHEQRECVYKALNNIPGISAVKPRAAFYIFPKVDVGRFNIRDDELLALDMLRREHILVTHGGGFHWIRPDHFRMVYLPEAGILSRACDRMGRFFEGYRQD